MSRYQNTRRIWLAALRRSGASLVYLLATCGIVPVPPPYLVGPATPDTGPASPDPASAPHTGPASPDPASAPLTASERRAWKQLARELASKSRRD